MSSQDQVVYTNVRVIISATGAEFFVRLLFEELLYTGFFPLNNFRFGNHFMLTKTKLNLHGNKNSNMKVV